MLRGRSWFIAGALALLGAPSSCALLGYDFGSYKPADGSTGGAGGMSASSSASSTSSASSASSAGGGGTGGASSSSGSGGGVPCKLASECSDGNACTDDTCNAGVCEHTKVKLDDGDLCTQDLCDPVTGASHPPVICDDSNVCTDDTCAPDKGCVFTPKPIPSDSDGCTIDGCDPVTGPTHMPIVGCCPHSVCSVGVPLPAADCRFADQIQMFDCMADLCGSNSSCCAPNGMWTSACVTSAQGICTPPPGPTTTCMCAHDYCKTGALLDPTCDPCVHAVCALLPTCCTGMWGAPCVAATHTQCNVPLGAECR